MNIADIRDYSLSEVSAEALREAEAIEWQIKDLHKWLGRLGEISDDSFYELDIKFTTLGMMLQQITETINGIDKMATFK